MQTFVRLSIGASAILGLQGTSIASVHFVSQSNVLNLSFSQPDFSDAVINGANTVGSTADAPGDSARIGYGIYQNPILNQHVTATAGVTVDDVTLTPTSIDFTVHHPTEAPGSHTYFYTRPQPDGPGFIASSIGGLTQLHLSLTSGPIVDAGDPFSWALKIPGDWSSQGSGPGQSQLLSLNPGWSIVQDFVFDGSATTLALSRDAGGANGPGVALNIYAAPSPGGAMLGLLAGLGTIRRRRKSRGAASGGA